MNTTPYNWQFYWNLSGNKIVRANLVYTPYVSPDNKTFCMSFNRDPNYHNDEMTLWTDELLIERFHREIKFYNLASTTLPTLKLLDIDYTTRNIFLEWHGDDFLMQGIKAGGYSNALPDWQEQWISLLTGMKSLGISKFSLHPNSWTVKDGILIPFNWFFCYDRTESGISLRHMLIQISSARQEKLVKVLSKLNMDLDTPYSILQLETVCLNSFRDSYPTQLIEEALSV